MDGRGAIVDRVAAPDGILSVVDGGFESVLMNRCGAWLAQHRSAPVLLSGMIGSRQGWKEAPYRDCPADATNVVQAMAKLTLSDGRNVHVVPGLRYVDPEGGHDVMRGEETQIFGLPDLERGDRVVCLPGTHSKWVAVRNGRIERFATYMTGEVYAVMSKHSILGRLLVGDAHDPMAFAAGLDLARRDGGLLHHLFRVRTAGLMNAMGGERLSSYLSGIVVGHEVRAALAGFPARQVGLVGSGPLTSLYAEALRRHGVEPRSGPEDAAAHGLYRLAAAMAA
jgi:2-dehydro-3-deoxygalactonokinase